MACPFGTMSNKETHGLPFWDHDKRKHMACLEDHEQQGNTQAQSFFSSLNTLNERRSTLATESTKVRPSVRPSLCPSSVRSARIRTPSGVSRGQF